MKISKSILFLLVLVVSVATAQTTLKGKVFNYKNQPVAKAKIYLDSVDTKIETNKAGEFSLVVPKSGSTIGIHSKKYGWLTSLFTDESTMNFMYLESDKSKKEKSQNNPQALNLEKDKNTVAYRTIYDMIRGKIAGVIVQPDNTIIIRGINSIKNNSEPLFVVDGTVVSSIDFIVPSEVKSISVLKDADASIYGSRGASGVIVIKMKN